MGFLSLSFADLFFFQILSSLFSSPFCLLALADFVFNYIGVLSA